jgi:hypothetical protein
MKKKNLDAKVLKYLTTNEATEMKKKINEKMTRFPDSKGEVLSPIIMKILSRIEESEDQQEKLEGILQIILLLVLQYN